VRRSNGTRGVGRRLHDTLAIQDRRPMSARLVFSAISIWMLSAMTMSLSAAGVADGVAELARGANHLVVVRVEEVAAPACQSGVCVRIPRLHVLLNVGERVDQPPTKVSRSRELLREPQLPLGPCLRTKHPTTQIMRRAARTIGSWLARCRRDSASARGDGRGPIRAGADIAAKETTRQRRGPLDDGAGLTQVSGVRACRTRPVQHGVEAAGRHSSRAHRVANILWGTAL